jgi:hypothetical protein
MLSSGKHDVFQWVERRGEIAAVVCELERPENQ